MSDSLQEKNLAIQLTQDTHNFLFLTILKSKVKSTREKKKQGHENTIKCILKAIINGKEASERAYVYTPGG